MKKIILSIAPLICSFSLVAMASLSPFINKFDDPKIIPDNVEVYHRATDNTIEIDRCVVGIKLKNENNPLFECTNLCRTKGDMKFTCDDDGCKIGYNRVINVNGFSFNGFELSFYKGNDIISSNICNGDQILKDLDMRKHPFTCENGKKIVGHCSLLTQGGNGQHTIEYTERDYTSFEVESSDTNMNVNTVEKAISSGIPIKLGSFDTSIDISFKKSVQNSFTQAIREKKTTITERTSKITSKCNEGQNAYIFVHYKCVEFDYKNCKNDHGKILGDGKFTMCRGVPTTNCGDQYDNCDLRLAKMDPVKNRRNKNKKILSKDKRTMIA